MMNKLHTYLVSIITLLVMLIGVSAARSAVRADGRLQILCSTTMIADAVREIAGESVSITRLMGPGIDPHLYRATESDVAALAGADLIFYNGLHLEGKMAEIFAQMNRYVPSIAVAHAIPEERLIGSEFEGMYDPHVWHDVSLWILVVREIEARLIQHDPRNALLYQSNAQKYVDTLTKLDQFVRSYVRRAHTRTIITGHDAFAYLGSAYGFEVIGLQGISTDAQISTKDIKDITQYILQYRVPAIFLESSIPIRNIQAVKQAVAAHGRDITIAPEIYSDALADPGTTAGTYCGMIAHNIQTIVDALSE